MKKNLNPIPKSKREKQRYVLLNKNVDKNIFNEFYYLYGLLGFTRMNLKQIDKNVFRINKEYVDFFIGGVNIYNIKNDLKIEVLKTSGTIKGLSKKNT